VRHTDSTQLSAARRRTPTPHARESTELKRAHTNAQRERPHGTWPGGARKKAATVTRDLGRDFVNYNIGHGHGGEIERG